MKIPGHEHDEDEYERDLEAKWEKLVKGDTQPLYLDEGLALGLAPVKDRGMPPLPKAELRIIEVIADNIFVYRTTLAWAVADALGGDSRGFERIREVLISRPVKLVKDGD